MPDDAGINLIKNKIKFKHLFICIFVLLSIYLFISTINTSISSIRSASIAAPLKISVEGNFAGQEITNLSISGILNFENVNREFIIESEDMWSNTSTGSVESGTLVKNKWLTSIKITCSREEFEKITNISLFIGNKNFNIAYNDLNSKFLLKSGDYSNSTFILKASDGFTDKKSRFPGLNVFMNWPGDFEAVKLFLIFSISPLIILILFLIIFTFINSFYYKNSLFNTPLLNPKIDDNIIAFLSLGLVTFLLLDIFSGYDSDWYNNIWLIGYNRDYFLSNLNFPLTLNTRDSIFYPLPIFYGYLFYPAAGIISIFLGPNLALRLIIIMLFIFQYYFCRKMFLYLTENRMISNTISILVSWSVYPLTNIYNRSAILEFTATTCAGIFLFIFIILLTNPSFDLKKKLKYFIYLFISFIFCYGTHPITTFYFSGMMIFAGILFYPFIISFFKTRSNIILSFLFVLLSLLILSPLIYLTLNFQIIRDLKNTNTSGIPILYQYIDTFINRFSIILPPNDERVRLIGIGKVATPYLDTQVNVSLILLILFIIIFNKIIPKESKVKVEKWFIFISFSAIFLIFITVSIFSLNNKLFRILPGFFSIIQFCYRLSNISKYAVTAWININFYLLQTGY